MCDSTSDTFVRSLTAVYVYSKVYISWVQMMEMTKAIKRIHGENHILWMAAGVRIIDITYIHTVALRVSHTTSIWCN